MQSMWDSKWYHSPTTDHPRHPTYWKNLKNLESSRHIHDGQVLLPLPRHGIENRCWRSATGADPSVRRMFDVGRAASGRRASGRFARRNGSARSRMSSDSMDVDESNDVTVDYSHLATSIAIFYIEKISIVLLKINPFWKCFRLETILDVIQYALVFIEKLIRKAQILSNYIGRWK